jgi:hypothetical protein
LKNVTFNIPLLHRILCFQDLDILPLLSLAFGTNKSCFICKNLKKNIFLSRWKDVGGKMKKKILPQPGIELTTTW